MDVLAFWKEIALGALTLIQAIGWKFFASHQQKLRDLEERVNNMPLTYQLKSDSARLEQQLIEDIRAMRAEISEVRNLLTTLAARKGNL